MAGTEVNSDQLGKAWDMHRKGDHKGAQGVFAQVLGSESSNIDAMYGLGLSQRVAGDMSGALSTFEKCLAEVTRQLASNKGDDHFEMLQRMVTQRIDELKQRAK